MAAAQPPTQLPNAPLVEAVFEMRWALQGPPGVPTLLHTDPGFLQTQEAFSARAAKIGFPARRDMTQGPEMPGGHTISRRFFPLPEVGFPILQIGPGIFATNQSTEYDWENFRKQALQGVRAVLESYPALPNFPMNPIYLELRYVD